eukprot:g7492.t1
MQRINIKRNADLEEERQGQAHPEDGQAEALCGGRHGQEVDVFSEPSNKVQPTNTIFPTARLVGPCVDSQRGIPESGRGCDCDTSNGCRGAASTARSSSSCAT